MHKVYCSLKDGTHKKIPVHLNWLSILEQTEMREVKKMSSFNLLLSHFEK